MGVLFQTEQFQMEQSKIKQFEIKLSGINIRRKRWSTRKLWDGN